MNLVAICLSIALAVTLPQEKPADRQPQKGDSIVVKGCLKGGSLESTETGFADSDARSMTALKKWPGATLPPIVGGSPSDRSSAPTSLGTAIGSTSGNGSGVRQMLIGLGRACCGRRWLERLRLG